MYDITIIISTVYVSADCGIWFPLRSVFNELQKPYLHVYI